ncbi:MAG: hypothetical protein RBQ76_09610 [Sulfurovum sp.]|jgi:hypothetical protein|nr:hypothetical protein [Sulfurovum sp.]
MEVIFLVPHRLDGNAYCDKNHKCDYAFPSRSLGTRGKLKNIAFFGGAKASTSKVLQGLLRSPELGRE